MPNRLTTSGDLDAVHPPRPLGREPRVWAEGGAAPHGQEPLGRRRSTAAGVVRAGLPVTPTASSRASALALLHAHSWSPGGSWSSLPGAASPAGAARSTIPDGRLRCTRLPRAPRRRREIMEARLLYLLPPRFKLTFAAGRYQGVYLQ